MVAAKYCGRFSAGLAYNARSSSRSVAMAEREKTGNTAIVLGLIAVLVGLYAVLYGLQTLTFLESRLWQRAHPELWQVPRTVPAASTSGGKGTEITAYNYKFEAPWSDLDKVDGGPMFASAAFRSGKRIVLLDPSIEVNVVAKMKSTQSEQFIALAAIFGESLFASNYALYDAVFRASPAQLSAFMPARESERVSALLLWKISLATNADTGIESFETKNLRGFELGDPSSAHYVLVKAFDTQDHQFELVFSARPDAPEKVSQSEINRVLETLRPEWQR
jgi:hypothetical protein